MRVFLAVFLVLYSYHFAYTQDSITTKINTNRFNRFFTPSDTFHKKRFWSMAGGCGAVYTGAVIGLSQVWYADYELTKMHSFDDSKEWLQIDKVGHVITAYQEAQTVYNGVRWAGVKNKNAALIGIGAATLFQTTLEVLDGYAADWGFSWSDIGANTFGCTLFGVQQYVWDEQRILFKISNTAQRYPDLTLRSTNGEYTTTLKDRTNDLFGSGYAETFFKDYNGMKAWLSVNPRSFMKEGRGEWFPDWLNIAVGYGATNVYGGFGNTWSGKNANEVYVLSPTDYPRTRQVFLSLDVDMSKLKIKNRFLRTVARTINFIKIPSPTLEYNSQGKFIFHPIFF